MSANPTDHPEADVPTFVPPPTPEQNEAASVPDPSRDQAASQDNADPDRTNFGPPTPVDPDPTNYPPTPTDWTPTARITRLPSPRTLRRTSTQRRLGNYELLREIKAGGMGIVYEACDVNLDRRVALKRILPRAMLAPGAVKRFSTEARAAAALHHPGIVPVYEVGEEDGQPYLVMQLANGGSLQQHLADGPLPPRLAADIIRQLAEAVQHAHDHGVVHRDLKPGNILLHHEGPASGLEPSDSMLREARHRGSLPTGWRVQLTDFGLARLATEEGLTATGEVMGTPSYMPPEQAVGNKKAMGPLVDVCSLGAVLYALLTGRPPFQAATPVEVLRMVQDQEPVSPRRLSPGVPLDLEAVCLRCLKKDPTRRYASAAALAADLGRFLRGEMTQARPVGPPGRVQRWIRRNPGVAALAAAVMFLLVAGVVVSGWFANNAGEKAIAARRAEQKADERAEAEAAEKNRKLMLKPGRRGKQKRKPRIGRRPRQRRRSRREGAS